MLTEISKYSMQPKKHMSTILMRCKKYLINILHMQFIVLCGFTSTNVVEATYCNNFTLLSFNKYLHHFGIYNLILCTRVVLTKVVIYRSGPTSLSVLAVKCN